MAIQHHSNSANAGVSAIVQHLRGAVALLEGNAEPIDTATKAELEALEARVTELLDEQSYSVAR